MFFFIERGRLRQPVSLVYGADHAYFGTSTPLMIILYDVIWARRSIKRCHAFMPSVYFVASANTVSGITKQTVGSFCFLGAFLSMYVTCMFPRSERKRRVDHKYKLMASSISDDTIIIFTNGR